MKRTALMLFCVFAVAGSFAQTAADALKSDNQSLRERYLLMKNKSQVYQDYNVIKRNILDGMWNIVEDSINAKQAAIRQSRAEINQLRSELNKNLEALKAKEASMEDIVYASTHIRVLGINFDKGVFAALVGVIILLSGLGIAAVIYSMKVMRKNLAEKEELANSISAEYEDYKRKAMEKQTKLSRELQNERNKLAELGSL